MEHQLGAYTDCNHGQGLAVLHPAYYRSQLPEATEKLARLARELWEIPIRGQSDTELANEAIDALSSFIRECGLPTRLSQLRTRTPITKSLLAQVADSCNRLATGCRQLTRDEIYELFCQCL